MERAGSGKARGARACAAWTRTPSFQTYDATTDAAQVAPNLAALRAELAKRGLDGFVVPHSDQHMGEYLPAFAERLAWLTAFTGSAGAAVVLTDKAAIFVDGRYTLQVRSPDRHLAVRTARPGGGRRRMAGFPTICRKGAKLGYDPWLHTAHGVMHLRAACEKAGATLVAVDSNPIDAVWTDQPAPPTTPAKPHALNLAGRCRAKPSACSWAKA